MKKFYLTISIPLLTAALALPVAAATITDKMKSSVAGLELPSSNQPEAVIGAIIQVFISIFGILFFGLMIYGGYKWMIAQGREEEVKKAKDIIRSAIIGLGVVFMAFAISLFVIRGFSAATGVGSEAEQTTQNQ